MSRRISKKKKELTIGTIKIGQYYNIKDYNLKFDYKI